jgi:hypothetical protein
MRCGLGALGIVSQSGSVGLQRRVFKSLDSDSWLLRSSSRRTVVRGLTVESLTSSHFVVHVQFPHCLELEPISAEWWKETLSGQNSNVASDTSARASANASADARSSVITPEGYLQCLPHMHGCDGAFAARVRVVRDVG